MDCVIGFIFGSDAFDIFGVYHAISILRDFGVPCALPQEKSAVILSLRSPGISLISICTAAVDAVLPVIVIKRSMTFGLPDGGGDHVICAVKLPATESLV